MTHLADDVEVREGVTSAARQAHIDGDFALPKVQFRSMSMLGLALAEREVHVHLLEHIATDDVLRGTFIWFSRDALVVERIGGTARALIPWGDIDTIEIV